VFLVARDRQSEDYITPLRRLFVGLLVLAMFGLFLIWRIDSPRVERFRAAVIEPSCSKRTQNC